MSNRFHNKFHRHNHHTTPTLRDSLYPDSAYDPIASFESPFLGSFYLSGDLVAYGSGYFQENLYVFGDVSRLETNTFITSSTDIFTINVTDDVPALKVTQLGGINGAPIARFLGNYDPQKDSGEFTIIFDKLGQVGIGTKTPESITHIKQQAIDKDAVLTLESVSTKSIFRIDSFDRGALHFAKNDNDATPRSPYALLEGDGEASLIFKSAAENTETIIESPGGNSYLVERIGPDIDNEGGLIVQNSGINCGKFLIQKSGTIFIKTGNFDQDVIIAYPTKNVLMTGNVAISGSAVIQENLTVMGGYTNLDTDVNITSAVNITYTGLSSALTVTQTGSSYITKLVNSNNDTNVLIQSLPGKNSLDFVSREGSNIEFFQNQINTPYFTASADNILSALKLFSSSNNDTNIIIDSKHDSLVTFRSVTGGKIDFQTSNGTSYYNIIGSPLDKGLKLTSSLSSTLLYAESTQGNSLIIQTINPEPVYKSYGGIIVKKAPVFGYPEEETLGSFTVDVSGVVHIASKLNPDAITIIPDDPDSNLFSKVGISVRNPNKELTVQGEISANGIIWDPYGNSSQWNSVYTTVSSNSANWQSTYTSVRNASATWDTVSGRLPLSGGTLTGLLRLAPLTGTDALKIWGNVTIYGDLSSTGLQSFANTIFTTTSSISVVNNSSATALYVRSKGSAHIASFIDADSEVEMLNIGGSDSIYPNIGIKTSTPLVDLTVAGSISAQNIIYDGKTNSSQWGSTFSFVSASSAALISTYTTVSSNSAMWSGIKIYDRSIAGISVDEFKNVILTDTTLDQELTGVATGVTFISSFSNSRRGNTYILTNKTTASIDIVQSPKIFIRQGHSWRATTSKYTNSFLTLPVSGSCAVRFDANYNASVW